MNKEQFKARIERIPGIDCWIWAKVSDSGYGYLYINYHQYLAHRYAWELYRGPIPEGLWILHKCDIKSCVNPDHLYLGTLIDNTWDAVDRKQYFYASQMCCKRGHEFTVENTYVKNGKHRECRVCSNWAKARYKADQKHRPYCILDR